MMPESDAPSQQCRGLASILDRRKRLWAPLALMVLGLPAFAGGMPTPAECLNAHATVRGWVRAWAVPPEPGEGPAALPVYGSAVTLRMNGRVLARSAWFSAQGATTEAVWRAAGEAVREASSKLPVEHDALAEERLERLGDRVTVSLEFFGEPVPVPDDELTLPLAGCSPGAEALVVSAGSGGGEVGRFVVSGVDSQLTRGADPTQEFGALAAQLSGKGETGLTPLDELLDAGYSFYRAPVVHLAMPFDEAAPVFLDRGARVVGDDAVRVAGVRRLADGVAAHLRSRLWPGVERFGIGGDLNIVTGASEPLVATPFEQGLAALALLRHAELDGPDAKESHEAGLSILRDLAAVGPGEETPWASPIAAAVTVGALALVDAQDRTTDPELAALSARSLEALRAAFDPDAGFSGAVAPPARGLIAWGLVRAMSVDGSSDRASAEEAVRAAFRGTPPAQRVAQTPFLVWAELELNPTGPVPSGAALDELRSLVWDHQIRKGDLRPIDRDLAGGVVFTRGRSVLPTWQSMKPLAALATMLGDERLTPGSVVTGRVPGEVVRVSEGLRFVRQLAVTGDGLFLARVPQRASWGVRGAVWDPTARVEAGAMALLTACEALESFERIAARGLPEGEPP